MHPLFHTGLLLPSTGPGARGTADMAGKRPLCAKDPMMSALILRFLLIKEKEQKPFTLSPPNNYS